MPPSSDMHFQSLPKGAMRILHGAKIQAEYREKKKQRELEEVRKKKNAARTDQLQIRDGEKMGDFNRCVVCSFTFHCYAARLTTRPYFA